MRYFMFTYDSRASGEPDITVFDDENSVVAAVKKAAIAKNDGEDMALFHVNFVDTLRKAHSRYFCTGTEIIHRMREVLEQLPRSARIQLTASEA